MDSDFLPISSLCTSVCRQMEWQQTVEVVSLVDYLRMAVSHCICSEGDLPRASKACPNAIGYSRVQHALSFCRDLDNILNRQHVCLCSAHLDYRAES